MSFKIFYILDNWTIRFEHRNALIENIVLDKDIYLNNHLWMISLLASFNSCGISATVSLMLILFKN